MNIKKLAPWNWFKKEENEANVHAIPVKREFRNQVNSYLPGTLQTFHDEIDRMFDNMFRQFGMLTPGSFDTSLKDHTESSREYCPYRMMQTGKQSMLILKTVC